MKIDYDSELWTSLDRIIVLSDNIMVLGDLNINLLGSKSFTTGKLNDLMRNYDSHNIITQPSCFKSQGSATLLDVIIVSRL